MDAGLELASKQSVTKRILIVEDDPVSALVLRRVLEQRGFNVDHCENGVTALNMFHQHRHGLIISDWMMPEMDGVSLTREVRKVGGQYTYMVLLSAKGQKQDRLDAFEAGVDDFLTKPLDRDELFARIKVAERILSAEENIRKQKEELAVATDRLKTANQNLLLASRRFEELFTGMPVACFTFDAEGMIHEWNRAAEHLFQREAHDAMLAPIWRVFQNLDYGFWTQDLAQEVFAGQSFHGVDWTYETSEGPLHLVCNIFGLRGASGEIIGAISANIDITERRQAEKRIQEQQRELLAMNEKLSQLAVTDGLTGLWNHRRFQEELEVAYATHSRKDWQLSLILLDVDHFKQFNDTFGHPAGDVVLKNVAGILKGTARQHEAVARYGGEEFAVILPGTTREEATLAAERFRAALAGGDWPQRDITASLGVATLEPGTRPEELIQQADAALYASKQAGRNRVSHYAEVGGGALGLSKSA